MIKIPFIEKTFVGVAITDTHLRWVELSKLGSSINVVGSGEITIEATLQEGIEKFKSQLSHDAYFVGVSDRRMFSGLEVMDAPFFEEAEEYEKWQLSEVEEFKSNAPNEHISDHLIALNEEEKRLLVLSNKSLYTEQLRDDFNELRLSLSYISSGFVELGYAQILNPEFVESYAAVLTASKGMGLLLVYNQGRITNSFELSIKDDPESLLRAADSILTSEELTLEVPNQSIPCFHDIDSTVSSLIDSDRSFNRLDPFFKKGKVRLDAKYAQATGVAVKMCYPELDELSLLDTTKVSIANYEYDKKELIRTAVLLFAPLVVFLFLAFAVEKWNQPALNEVAQVSEFLGDQLSLISTEREKIIELQSEFNRRKQQFEAIVYVAPVLMRVSSTIPDNVWLQELSVVKSDANLFTELVGISEESQAITEYIQALQASEQGSIVRLMRSETMQDDIMSKPTTSFSLRIENR